MLVCLAVISDFTQVLNINCTSLIQLVTKYSKMFNLLTVDCKHYKYT